MDVDKTQDGASEAVLARVAYYTLPSDTAPRKECENPGVSLAELERRDSFHDRFAAWDVLLVMLFTLSLASSIFMLMVLLLDGVSTFGLAALFLSLAGTTPSGLVALHYRRRVQQSPEPSEIFLPYQIALAWQDWCGARDGVGKLEPNGEAHAALLVQDGLVREALLTYLTEPNLALEQKEEFRDWFFTTCAQAHELMLVEKRRVELAATFESSSAIALALNSLPLVLEATQTSRVLTEAAQAALEGRVKPPAVS